MENAPTKIESVASNNNDAAESQESHPQKIGVIRVPFGEEVASIISTSGSPAVGNTVSNAVVSREDILRRAKLLAPGIKQCAKLLSRTTVKILRGQLRGVGVVDSRATEIAEIAGWSDDCIDTLKDSGSRLLAPRIKNEEAADVLALSGCLVEISGGILDVVMEIRKLGEEIKLARK